MAQRGPGPASRKASAGKTGSPPASARLHPPFSPSPQIGTQGRVPEVKGPCWWVTPGEVPGEKRTARCGSARRPRVSEGRREGWWLAGPPFRAAAGVPVLARATGLAAGGLAPALPGPSPGRPLRGPFQPQEVSRHPRAGLPSPPPGLGEDLGTGRGSAAHSRSDLVVTAFA